MKMKTVGTIEGLLTRVERNRICFLLAAAFLFPFAGVSQTPAPATRESVLQHLADVMVPGKQRAAIQSIKAMGTNAVPVLIEILGYQPSQVEQWYERIYVKLPEGVRSHMSKPEAAEKLRTEATFLLLGMRETTLYLTNLFPLLKDPRVEVRRGAADLISSKVNRPDFNDRLLLEVLPAMKDSDPQVRRDLVRAMANGAADFPRVRAALATMLTDEDEEVRVNVANSILKADRDHLAALAALRNAFSSTNAGTRYFAAAYYLKSGTNNSRADDQLLPIFIGSLSAKEQWLHQAAPYSLISYGSRAKAAVPRLQSLLTNGTFEVREAATNALRKIAPETLQSK